MHIFRMMNEKIPMEKVNMMMMMMMFGEEKERNSKQVYRWLQYTQNLSIDVGMNSNRRF